MTQFRGAVDLSTLSSAPSSPASGYQRLYPKTDYRLYTVDSAGNEAQVGHPGGFTPYDHGAVSWSFDLCAGTAGQAMTAGQIYLIGQQVARPATVSTIWWCNQSSGSSLTAGQCWTALINSSGTVLGSADISSKGGVNLQSGTFTPVSVTPGFYWTAFLFNGTDRPSLLRQFSVSGAVNNFNRPDSMARFATYGGTSSTTIANITPASVSKYSVAMWAALG